MIVITTTIFTSMAEYEDGENLKKAESVLASQERGNHCNHCREGSAQVGRIPWNCHWNDDDQDDENYDDDENNYDVDDYDDDYMS